MESLLSLLAEHGVLAIILALSIYGGIKLLNYTKTLIEKNEERLNAIITQNIKEREAFVNVLDKHAKALEDLKQAIDSMRDVLQVTNNKY
jgi:hypothetical protein